MVGRALSLSFICVYIYIYIDARWVYDMYFLRSRSCIIDDVWICSIYLFIGVIKMHVFPNLCFFFSKD